MRAYAQFVHILISNNTKYVRTHNITNFMLCGQHCVGHCVDNISRRHCFFFNFYYFYFCCFSPRHYYKYNKQTGKLYLQPDSYNGKCVAKWKKLLNCGCHYNFFLLLLFGVANECYGSSIIMSVLLISFDNRDFLFI